MSKTSDTELAIGPGWSPSAPCFVHFNLAPPQTVDPISVSTFSTGATVTVSNSVAWSDDLYVYLQAPAYSGGVETRPKRIVLQTQYPTYVQCAGCIVETAGAGQRMFPAFSVPVGVARVVGGVLHPAMSSIIDSHQLYIGSDIGITVRPDGAGVWLELSTAAATSERARAAASLATTSLEVARARTLALQPLDSKRLESVEKKLADLQADITPAIRALAVTPEALAEVEVRIQSLFDSMQGQFLDLRGRYDEELREASSLLRSESEQFVRLIPARVGGTCQATPQPTIGGDADGRLLVCSNGKWKKGK